MIEEYLTRQHLRMAQGQHTIWPIIQHGNRHEAITLADLSANGMLWMGLFGLLLVMNQLLTFLTGLGWSIYYPYIWITAEMEVCPYELCGLQIPGTSLNDQISMLKHIYRNILMTFYEHILRFLQTGVLNCCLLTEINSGL